MAADLAAPFPFGYAALVAAVALERVVELALSTRNRRRALARGGVELGQGHYPLMVALHSGFLLACVLESWWLRRPLLPVLAVSMLVVLALSMALRYWAIASLGERWNTRVVLVPGDRAVATGPYRFVRHPNYVAVVLEMAALPLIHTAVLTALVGSALNAWLLAVRIGVEERALREHARYDEALAGRGRFLPGPRDDEGLAMTALSRDEILAGIAAVASEHLNLTGPIRPEMGLIDDLRLDSLRLLTLAVEVENRFRVRLDPDEEASIATVGDLIDTVARKLAPPDAGGAGAEGGAR